MFGDFDFCSPLFVTWKKQTEEGLSLRGCMGTFSSMPLEEGLKKYARLSAFEDTRFDPVEQEELETLVCSVSLLGDFEPCADNFDWIIGTHGIKIAFSYNRVLYSATYLPEVAKEQNWTQLKTLEHLVRKTGFRGSIDTAMSSLALERYTSSIASATYLEYKQNLF